MYTIAAIIIIAAAALCVLLGAALALLEAAIKELGRALGWE